MNLAGRSVFGAVSFFNYDMFSKCYIDDYKNPFTADIITVGMSDDLNYADFMELDKIPEAVKMMPQFIHIDASLTGDKTGISSVGVSGVKETKQYIGADESIVQELTYKHIFSLAVQAPQGTEISLEKTRQFIYFLKAAGFNIRGVSLDGFQSADTKQLLRTQGYDAEIVSLDKTPQGYLALRSAMNDGRIGLIQIDLLEKEFIQLQRDVQTGKIDHPIDGSKDLSDSVAGAFWNATLHKQSLIDSLQLFEVAFDVNNDTDPRESFMKNMEEAMLSGGKTTDQRQQLADDIFSNLLNADSDIISW
jgi:hypothetical protein